MSPRPLQEAQETTWGGCGRHISAIKASVPTGQWCPGHSDGPKDSNGTLLSRILGR